VQAKPLPPTKRNVKDRRIFIGKIRLLNAKILLPTLKVISDSLKENPDKVIAILAELEKEAIEKYAKASRPAVKLFTATLIQYYTKQIDQILEKHRMSPNGNISEEKKEEIQQNCQTITTKIAAVFFLRILNAVKKNQLISYDEAIITGKPPKFDIEAIKKRMRRVFKMANNHAKMIAQDQTNKILSMTNILKYKLAGLTSYIWRTSEDERVVGNPTGLYPLGNASHEDHYSRDGKIFRFDMPPSDGHPGQPVNCRCDMLPLLKIE
jgi:uncharacterized protein with gpF-like domain